MASQDKAISEPSVVTNWGGIVRMKRGPPRNLNGVLLFLNAPYYLFDENLKKKTRNTC